MAGLGKAKRHFCPGLPGGKDNCGRKIGQRAAQRTKKRGCSISFWGIPSGKKKGRRADRNWQKETWIPGKEGRSISVA